MSTGAAQPERGGNRRAAYAAGRAVAAVLAALLVAAPAPAAAQEAPYVGDLLRLSELLGALHHLRPLCGAAEKRLWRDKMATLLAAENPTAEVRGRMITRFNRSYRDISETYRTCTPAAEALIERYAAEGERITADIVQRYSTKAP
jgi:uncharacterized protein (TIGR02301 family)